MSPQSIEREILSLATEDYQGLWEIRSHLEQVCPTLRQDVRRAAAGAALRLLGRGWIDIVEGSLPAGGAIPLPANLAREALQAAAAWDLPDTDARELLMAATRAGEEAYASHALEPPP